MRRPVKRALLSASDKTGLVACARRLAALGIALVSTGGSAACLKKAGLTVCDVSALTGQAEMMDGRVKTLHPAIHGGILFRRDMKSHCEDARIHDIPAIDLVYVNLYPFAETVASGADRSACIERIDIGGPALLRAAAKNADWVTVCAHIDGLEAALAEMEADSGHTSTALRHRLAAESFARTAEYDTAIADWYAGQTAATYRLCGVHAQTLRYGENPHQKAALYRTGDGPGVVTARICQGKPLSYNNINDLDAAFALACEYDPKDGCAAVIVKHVNPCGVAIADGPGPALRRARHCDPVSAFGGIIAFNHALDADAATTLIEVFTEAVIAPDATPEALDILSRKKNLRILLSNGLRDPHGRQEYVTSVGGGFLVQERDTGRLGTYETVTDRPPDNHHMRDLRFAWNVVKHARSNAIVMAHDNALAGLGCGQTSRVEAVELAARKAASAGIVPSVAASDAFFPFADGVLAAAKAGVQAIIQPGGSIRDAEVIAAANDAGIAMVFTHLRHFRH